MPLDDCRLFVLDGVSLLLDYVYISDPKVDMIVDQMPTRLRDRIAGELKIDLKVVSVTVSEQRSPQNRYARARIAVEYIFDNYDVGTVEAPGPYFEGSLPMRWGVYPEERLEEPLVYFGGFAENTSVGLGGSARHVLGSNLPASGVSTFMLAGSALPSIVQLFGRSEHAAEASGQSEQEVLDQAKAFTSAITGVREDLRFLARRLLVGDSGGRMVLVGSPVFVARAIT